MNIYDSNGYVNFRGIMDKGYPYNIMVGGRGTGKTYGALKTHVVDKRQFMYMRRRQTQVDIINKPEFSPIKPVCRDLGLQITMRPVAKGLSAFVPYEVDEEKNKEIISGPPFGYTCALSTVANLRGFDASEVRSLIYDEFIPEKAERPLPHEADALFNCYETLNRNRELEGQPPLQLFCLANANDQTAPILERLRLITRIEKMRKTGQEIFVDNRRGLLLLMLKDSPISEKKRDTALYRLTEGTDFAEMALDNDFAYEDRGAIVSRPLAEYRPLASIGEITIYRHKGGGPFYVSTHRSGKPPTFGLGDSDRERFRRTFGWLWESYLAQNIEFEDYLCQILLTKYLFD